MTPSDDEIRKVWNRTQDPIATVRAFLPAGVALVEARKAFEVWARGPAGYVDDQLAKYANGMYQDSTTLLHWNIWRAAWQAAAGVQASDVLSSKEGA